MNVSLSVLLIGIILFIMFTTPAFAAYNINPPKLKTTQLTIDPLAECTNDFQCNATFLVGDTVTFTGLLTDSDGKLLRDMKINIYRFVGTEIQLLTSTVTDIDGTFKATWQTRFLDKKVAGETFTQKIQEVSTIFAKFEGDEKYASSQSNKFVITVKILDFMVHVATDQKLYRAGNSALVFINFIEVDRDGKNIRYGNFIDPDTIVATYDGKIVQLEKKKQGSYSFITPALTIGHHQLLVNPSKEGYNSNAGFITVQVSGFFGK